MTQVELEAPECELGYPLRQLQRVLGIKYPQFSKWFAGQTGAICDGRKYSYERKEYEPTGCGPHGMVVYTHDLRNFLQGGRVLD